MIPLSFLNRLKFWTMSREIKQKEVTFDQNEYYAVPDMQNVFSQDHLINKKPGNPLGPPGKRGCVGGLNGQGKAHAHFTAHVTTHHTVEVCITHNGLRRKTYQTYRDDMCISHPISFVNTFLFAEVAHDVSGHLQLGQCDFHLTVSQFPLDKTLQMKYKHNNL